MDVISDIKQNQDLIERSMEKYGYCAEHYYYCFLYSIEEWEIPYIFRFDDDSLILAKYDKADNDWYVFVGILAPLGRWVGYFKEFLDYCFEKGARKVWIELQTYKRKELLAHKLVRYKINRINYTLVWPVFRMNEWAGDRMEGKDWKDMRYYWNRFFRDHKVEFKEGKDVPKDELKQMIERWKSERGGKDKVYIDYYMNVIDNDFEGYDSRIMVVDGKICSITAGYKLPHRNYYYSSLGLNIKEFDRVGEIANMDDLITLKKKGIEIVDFGGGEKHLIEFKKKFKPSYYY